MFNPFSRKETSLPITNPLTPTKSTFHDDEPLSPHTLQFPRKSSPQPPAYQPSHPYPTIPNWNDPPPTWTQPSYSPSQHGHGNNPAYKSRASSTAYDITALYATANPRATPRRRQSSIVKSANAPPAPATPPPPQYAYGLYDDWRGSKIENGKRASVVGGYGYSYPFGEDEEVLRRRGRKRRVIQVVAVVMLFVTLGGLGVWIKGGPYTGMHGASSGEVSWAWKGNGNGSILPGAESMAGFGERCKAWSWRSGVPGFLSRYFSVGEGGQGQSGEGEVETVTRTIHMHGFGTAGVVSRVTRGRNSGDVGGVWTGPSEGDADKARETVLGEPRRVGPEEVDEWEREFKGLEGRDVSDSDGSASNGAQSKIGLSRQEEEAHRARASQMWAKHASVAPLMPPADSEHGKRQAERAKL